MRKATRTLTVLSIVVSALFLARPASADAPVLVAYGDSITAGQTSGTTPSPGYAKLLADAEGWGILNYSAGGMGATYFGKQTAWYMTQWVKQSGQTPAALLVGFGTNDMTCDYYHRCGTVEDFYAAMTTIVDIWQGEFPGVPVYIEGILWRSDSWNAQRPAWNAELKRVATEQGATYYLPNLAGLKFFADGLHPTAKGHSRLAAKWAKVAA